VTRADILRDMAEWAAVAPLVDEVREACTQLRWHPALRRRIPEAAAESRVRGARASADLDGARVDEATVRRMLCGAAEPATGQDATDAVVRAAVQATAEAEHVAALLRKAPGQAITRVAVAAGAPLLPADAVARPRRDGEAVLELTDLGQPPAAGDVAARLQGVSALLVDTGAPAYVVAALVHAELAHVRPFVRGNGLVARAVDRAYVVASGLDPTGVAVPEVGLGHEGSAAYVGSLAAYATGRREGVELWLIHWGRSMLAAVAEGRQIADAVLAGRLG
jgi:Fic family protein